MKKSFLLAAILVLPTFSITQSVSAGLHINCSKLSGRIFARQFCASLCNQAWLNKKLKGEYFSVTSCKNKCYKEACVYL